MEKTAVRIQGRESVAMTTAEFGRLFATWRARFEAIACRYVRSAAVAEARSHGVALRQADGVRDGFPPMPTCRPIS